MARQLILAIAESADSLEQQLKNSRSPKSAKQEPNADQRFKKTSQEPC